MATEAQIQANRLNAQKSTGPRTPEGKEKASQNALKHGLLAREGIIRGEDEEQYRKHAETLMKEMFPLSSLEEMLADRVIDLTWRLKRAAQDQNAVFATLYEKQAAAEGAREPDADEATLGRMLLADFSENGVLERLLRYERRIENSLFRTIRELGRLHDRSLKEDDEREKERELWRQEGWNPQPARALTPRPPAAVSPGSPGGTTNTTRAAVPLGSPLPSLQDAAVAPAPQGQVRSGRCETKPIAAVLRENHGQDARATHGQDAHATRPTAGGRTNGADAGDEWWQTKPTVRSELRQTNPISGPPQTQAAAEATTVGP